MSTINKEQSLGHFLHFLPGRTLAAVISFDQGLLLDLKFSVLLQIPAHLLLLAFPRFLHLRDGLFQLLFLLLFAPPLGCQNVLLFHFKRRFENIPFVLDEEGVIG